ncbi:2-phosphosulfolactate phosphatase [Actinotalea ferrariae]|uniref:2-phosphosulfolactate phosphatase n=1 Tax=Actinotalea ferrariae TaxID=1386098 RepID=UPI001C8C70DA|nr:2-phosphosulfolactate phosphatase [Actinotalea ferrariae]MBX9243651.1 2-phosphosulfolactate phosphatase [Actinotalea ferrariae]
MHTQSPWTIRLEWGPYGAGHVAAGADVAVVVDVLSFTTALSVAADLGTVVLPYPRHDADAVAYAEAHDAVLAGRRSARDVPSLSPVSLRRTTPPSRLVLPSPNGSTIAAVLAGTRAEVVGACLRNAEAVARWVISRRPRSVAVVPAGERWPDGGLRPAAEDLWGAGAVVEALRVAGLDDVSPEARTAAAAYREVARDIRASLHDCASGRELADAGYGGDVDVAAEVGQGRAVPVLTARGFVPAPVPPQPGV